MISFVVVIVISILASLFGTQCRKTANIIVKKNLAVYNAF